MNEPMKAQKAKKSPKTTLSTPAPSTQNKGGVLEMTLKPGQTEDMATAELIGRGIAANATTVVRFMASDHDGLSLTDMCAELQAQGEAANRGDMAISERMLIAQASALNAMFNGLAKRACMNMGEHMGAMETYMRLALKAQSQCARTIEVLATIKNPPLVFAKQANISNGPQQVNNGTASTPMHAGASAHGGKPISDSIELLETSHGQRLDFGAQATASGTHQDMATVGKVNRPQD